MAASRAARGGTKDVQKKKGKSGKPAAQAKSAPRKSKAAPPARSKKAAAPARKSAPTKGKKPAPSAAKVAKTSAKPAKAPAKGAPTKPPKKPPAAAKPEPPKKGMPGAKVTTPGKAGKSGAADSKAGAKAAEPAAPPQKPVPMLAQAPASQFAPKPKPKPRPKRDEDAPRPLDGKPQRVEPDVSDETVASRTGRDWKAWFALLDAKGADRQDHQGIVQLVREAGADALWEQMVAATYEQARGLRQRHERQDGFTITASRVIDASVERLFLAWVDKKARRRWLGDHSFRITAQSENKALRALWEDGKTRLEARFYDKGPNKSLLALEHTRLPDARSAARMKGFWRDRVESLRVALET